MNQILVTGYEGEGNYQKQVKPKKVIDIKKVIIFYAIFIIILGICIICGSAYAKIKINETVEANKKPILQVNRNDDNNTLNIEISHIRGIETIKYKWNDEAEQSLLGHGNKQIKETIPLIGGENTFTVSVTEENGQTVTYTNTYNVNIPTIKLEPVSNGVKIKSTSKEGVDYIKYTWDEGDTETITVGQEEYEGIINAPEGKHTLHIEAVDTQGNNAILEQLVVGDKAPTVKISAENKEDAIFFVVDVEDDTEISEVEITLNGQLVDSIDVKEKTYHKEIEVKPGENRLIVKAININKLETQKGVKYVK